MKKFLFISTIILVVVSDLLILNTYLFDIIPTLFPEVNDIKVDIEIFQIKEYNIVVCAILLVQIGLIVFFTLFREKNNTVKSIIILILVILNILIINSYVFEIIPLIQTVFPKVPSIGILSVKHDILYYKGVNLLICLTPLIQIVWISYTLFFKNNGTTEVRTTKAVKETVQASNTSQNNYVPKKEYGVWGIGIGPTH
ncbi:MAG: hypothetical protein GY828_02710 [Candidatus Gracilibacteria bacterium]|nr:hypothetical protein [Candidatus Gracilibacteria bacterium]